MPILEVWYTRFDVEAVLGELRSEMPRKAVRQTEVHLSKARARRQRPGGGETDEGRRRAASDSQ